MATASTTMPTCLYQFIWHEFCDWYIEMSKLALNGVIGNDPDGARKRLSRIVGSDSFAAPSDHAVCHRGDLAGHRQRPAEHHGTTVSETPAAMGR